MESGRDHDSDAFEESVHDDFDDFDDYSDSFESSDGNEGDGTQHHTETSIELRSGSARPVHDAKNSHQWELGDRVQVHWQDANEWFAGRVVQVDPLRDRYFVHYDDDDEAWEDGESLRYAPEMFDFDSTHFHQLQLLSRDDDEHLRGGNVLVYWTDSASWFAGKIIVVDELRGFHIEYEDGDVRWEAKSAFSNILVLTQLGKRQPKAPSASSLPPPPPIEVERVLIPRPYQTAITDHFQPERIARAYVSVTNSIGSILTARRNYSERKYLHAKMECATSSESGEQGEETALARDCLVQTEIIGAVTDGNALYPTCC